MMLKKILLGIAVLVVIITFPLSIYSANENSKADDRRAVEQRRQLCLHDQKQYDVLHALIERTGQPSAVPLADRLALPAETPAWFKVVLGQIAASSDPSNLAPFFAILGERPACRSTGSKAA